MDEKDFSTSNNPEKCLLLNKKILSFVHKMLPRYGSYRCSSIQDVVVTSYLEMLAQNFSVTTKKVLKM